MELTTMTKILYPTCDFQKSKEVVHVTYNARDIEHISLWFCPQQIGTFIGFAHREKIMHMCKIWTWDEFLAHSLGNVEMTSVHIMKIFTWMSFSMFGWM